MERAAYIIIIVVLATILGGAGRRAPFLVKAALAAVIAVALFLFLNSG